MNPEDRVDQLALLRDELEALPPIDLTQYAWVYRCERGTFVSDQPDAPAWTHDAWRATLVSWGATDDEIKEAWSSIQPTSPESPEAQWPESTLLIAKTPELGAELDWLQTAREVMMVGLDQG